MSKLRDTATGDLLSGLCCSSTSAEALAQGATLLRDFASSDATILMNDLEQVLVAAPFRHMVTPGGFRMSVAMSNCGRAGWITDRTGYRYAPVDPTTGRPWPPIPASFMRLATRAAAEGGFEGFEPDACLINCYEPGARLTLHQDKNERDLPRLSYPSHSECRQYFCSVAPAVVTGHAAFDLKTATWSCGVGSLVSRFMALRRSLRVTIH